MQQGRTLHVRLSIKCVNCDGEIGVFEHVLDLLEHLRPLKIVKATTNARHCKAMDRMTNAMVPHRTQTRPQRSVSRCIVDALLCYQVVDEAALVLQYANSPNLYICSQEHYTTITEHVQNANR